VCQTRTAWERLIILKLEAAPPVSLLLDTWRATVAPVSFSRPSNTHQSWDWRFQRR